MRPVCTCEDETEDLVTETKPKLGCLYEFVHLNVSSRTLVLGDIKQSSPWAQTGTVAILIFCIFTAPSSSRSQGTLNVN